MEVVKGITLDLLDQQTPALSSTNDIPIIETKPDASPPKEEVKPEIAAPEEKPAPAAEEKPEESASPEQPDDTAAEPEPKKAKGVQKRIDELTRQREDERRLREAAEARLDRALSVLEKGTVKEAKSVVDEAPQKPVKDPNNPEAYDADLERYVTEQASYIAEKKVKEKLAEDEKTRTDANVAEQIKQARERYQKGVEKAKGKYSDFQEKAESPDIMVSPVMAQGIFSSDDGPEIAYYLGNNPAEAERISKLQPQLQLVELGKISAKLETPAENPKPVSAAPSPGKPIKASSETKLTPEEEPMETYAARRKKEMAERGRPGVRH